MLSQIISDLSRFIQQHHEDELLLAKKIATAWDAWLKVKYPILSPEETGSTVGVVFFESRS
ncbi:MAG: hypothetical protein KDK56_00260 [Simkania sp.]|nr:hypothetical protein [Simkania sp.]MCB1075469.1 hypothetical protein [Simkania sp.]